MRSPKPCLGFHLSGTTFVDLAPPLASCGSSASSRRPTFSHWSIARVVASWTPGVARGVFVHLCARYVVLNTAMAKGTAGNSFYGLTIGMTVMAGASRSAASPAGSSTPRGGGGESAGAVLLEQYLGLPCRRPARWRCGLSGLQDPDSGRSLTRRAGQEVGALRHRILAGFFKQNAHERFSGGEMSQ